MRYRIQAINLDIGPHEAFRDAEGNSYPANWTSLVTPAHLAAIGMEAYEPVTSQPEEHIQNNEIKESKRNLK